MTRPSTDADDRAVVPAPTGRRVGEQIVRVGLFMLVAPGCFSDPGPSAGPDATSTSVAATTATTQATTTPDDTEVADTTTTPDATTTTTTTTTTRGATASTGADATTSETGCVLKAWYPDLDEDEHGDAMLAPLLACEPPRGHVGDNDDCDDHEPLINPAQDELCDGVDNDCDELVDEWSPANDSCDGCSFLVNQGRVYGFCEPGLPWHLAREACATRGMDLVIITSALEQLFLESSLMDLGSNANWWIGLSDEIVEGEFGWVDSTPLEPGYTHWAFGEPNNSGGNEDCAQLWNNNDWMWNDGVCAAPIRYICEGAA